MRLIMEKENINKNKCLIAKKENVITSLFEVEHFLCNIKKIFNTISLYHILK